MSLNNMLAGGIVAGTIFVLCSTTPNPLHEGKVPEVQAVQVEKPKYQRGTASWYGEYFHGRKTATGHVYDMHAMTAAHRTLPIPSYAKIVDTRTKREVVVLINDRGPYKGGRVLDLSYGAAKRLGFVDKGLTEVEIIPLTGRVSKKQRPPA